MATATISVPATQAQLSSLSQKTGRGRSWTAAGVLAVIAIIVFSVLSNLLQTGPAPCPSSCRQPPPPVVAALPPAASFTSSAYGYSLAYDPGLPPAAQDSGSITWELQEGNDIGAYQVSAQLAGGRGPSTVVQDLVNASQFPDAGARLQFAIPGAEIGYQSGAGNLYYEPNITPNQGQATQGNIIAMAAVKRDSSGRNVAITVFGFATRDPALNPGHPLPEQTFIGFNIDQVINTVLWAGEKPL
ncbi:MAG TPA: hypothetical protein VFB58_17625 [Chloroflexota bacterium]|nr:hypothetical protein [Chloroflexota bacterium]